MASEEDQVIVDPTKGWFKTVRPEETYYSIFSSFKSEYFFSNEGKERPSPKEVSDLISVSGTSYDYTTGVFSKNTQILEEEEVTLPSGAYEYIKQPYPERLVPMEIRHDGAAQIGNALGSVRNSFHKFLEKEEVYRKQQMIYKLGILLYSNPGLGKTSAIRQLLREDIVSDAVIIFLNQLPSNQLLNRLKLTKSDIIKIFVFEELTEALDKQGMDQVLNFLDGETSLDKSIILATTNYPAALPGNLVNRPSRFDKLIHVDYPKPEDRSSLIKYFLDRDATEEEVKSTHGLSIAAIKEVCLRVSIEDESFMSAVKALQERDKICKKMFKNTKDEMGFTFAKSFSEV